MSTKLDKFEHVVVLMLENRSFDNLLGNLYKDDIPRGQKFLGVYGKDITNPIPSRAKDSHKKKVMLHDAEDYHQPYPDPGEEYQHVNTQLFNTLDEHNIGKIAIQMTEPFNRPEEIPEHAPMSGFVNDYVNTLQALEDEDFSNPSYEQYRTIMQCFQPEQVPVISTLAKEFAVFDHWHCSVPTQTWANRAFWHAGTSGGFVVNPIGEDGETKKENIWGFHEWRIKNWGLPTLFSRLNDKNVSNKIYSNTDIPFPGAKLFGVVSLTALIHGHLEKWGSLKSFYHDIKNGDLPQYSFLEPNFFGQHNDQHPSAVRDKNQVGTVLLGEKLIYDVYTAIRNSTYRDKTLLIITHDEHGGCFDHVSPPGAIPPKEGQEGQNGFNFDRLGVRVPMVMISSHIEPNTIVNDVFDHCSFSYHER